MTVTMATSPLTTGTRGGITNLVKFYKNFNLPKPVTVPLTRRLRQLTLAFSEGSFYGPECETGPGSWPWIAASTPSPSVTWKRVKEQLISKPTVSPHSNINPTILKQLLSKIPHIFTTVNIYLPLLHYPQTIATIFISYVSWHSL